MPSASSNLIMDALTRATKAVTDAETAKTQASIDSALKLVNTLPASDAKTSLLNRLKLIKSIAQQSISLNNAVTAVNNAEKYLTQSYVEIANRAIALLNDSDSKTALRARLDAAKLKININNATRTVVNAENNLAFNA